ncbi:coiled-coil domain-containing protein 66 isoform X2 [Corythoichthys intestinalis]|uniref:coiled-coil domain-containing protein 66 isoform X2 n=1 Tax=Corythoichthys intestinalis TaxID=161448 RepID=UPI0025A4E9DB|nr:coiled-coil domain-containing protein 66 isoform X2 [Corythoichthys intestinalis]
MYLGDGLLFELQNGKPKLIVLNQGGNHVKNCRRPRPRGAKTQMEESGTSYRSSGTAARIRGSQTSLKIWERPALAPAAKSATKLKSEHQKGSCTSAKGTSSQSVITSGPSNSLGVYQVRALAACSSGEQELRDVQDTLEEPGESSLHEGHDRTTKNGIPPQETSSQSVITSGLSNSLGVDQARDLAACFSGEQELRDIQDTPEEPGESSLHFEEVAEGDDGTTKNGISTQETVSKSCGGLFGWLEQHDINARVSEEAKKSQRLQQQNARVALKQQHLQCSSCAEDEGGSVHSLQLRSHHRDQPAAIRSSLRLGAVTPEDEAWASEKREEQRRLWVEDLDRQREESKQRRRREKILLAQEADHQQWAGQFESLQRNAPAPALPPPIERGPSPAFSLTGDTDHNALQSAAAGAKDLSSCSYRRSMTALLDPVQMEERQKRRLKQLQQQKDIQAQVEEKQKQRREEQARRREQEEEEERKVTLERDVLRKRYQLEEHKKQDQCKEQPKGDAEDGGKNESVDIRVPHLAESVDKTRDMAVQTDTPDPTPLTCKSKAGKENIAAKGGSTPKTEIKTEKTRPDWNKRRPGRRFIPASERYPATLQRSRQESRLKRQEEMLGLQERNCQSRKDHWKRASTSAQRERSPPVTQPSLQFQFIPYIRTEDVIHLDPTNTASHSHTAATKQQRQQEIIRGLQQLRQGLLQKQKELESDLRRGDKQRSAPPKC